jgi:acyl carrier protein
MNPCKSCIRYKKETNQMTRQEIEEKLIEGISAILSVDKTEMAPDKPFKELGLDSLGFVEVLVFIEKTFKLNLVEMDLTKKDFESINSLSAFISKKL